jgi:hypothetical protein
VGQETGLAFAAPPLTLSPCFITGLKERNYLLKSRKPMPFSVSKFSFEHFGGAVM